MGSHCYCVSDELKKFRITTVGFRNCCVTGLYILMNNSTAKQIINGNILKPQTGQFTDSLFIADGVVQSTSLQNIPDGTEVIDAQGQLITPGLIDLHTHGIGLYCYDSEPELLPQVLTQAYKYGVTSLLPTLLPSTDSKGLSKLQVFSSYLESAGGENVAGLHLEGPFVAISGAACQTIPADITLLEEILSACRGQVRAMTIAPEVSGILPVIERLCEHKISIFISHTRADFEQTQLAIDAGARHATHFYDVFFPPDVSVDGGVRPAGAVEAILGDPRCTVDFIPDGVHVHPGVIRMALSCKGIRGVSIITDSNVGAGLEDGVYQTPWGFSICVGPQGGARIADPNHPKYGRLAGSVLTMDAGVNNMIEWMDQPIEQIWAMATTNPADVIGLSHKGRLEVGCDADLVFWDRIGERFVPTQTWVSGKCIWMKDADDDTSIARDT
jgi:N-acetylglucosamine-6-phosphate deacetylase